MCGIRSSTHSYPQQRLPKPNQISYMLIQFISFPFRFGYFHSAQWAFSPPPSPDLTESPPWSTFRLKKQTNKQACVMPGTITDTSCDIDLRLKCCFWGDIFRSTCSTLSYTKHRIQAEKCSWKTTACFLSPYYFLQKSCSALSTHASVTCQYTRNVDLDIGCWEWVWAWMFVCLSTWPWW